MGVWGIKNFENDSALDWVYEFQQNISVRFIQQTINKVIISKGFLDSDIAIEALAAIEIIAAIRGNPSNEIPDIEGIDFDSMSEELKPIYIQQSKKAIERIMSEKENELFELWKETSDFKKWLQVQKDLLTRLDS